MTPNHLEQAMTSNRFTSKCAALVAAIAALILAAPAGAATYRLAGRQIAVNADQGIFTMTGSLVGDWNITAFNQTATTPLLEANGTELFKGCLDLRRDGCDRRDPTGTLNFTFTYQALFASPDPASIVWGSCRHPIVSGTGGFAGAQGVIAMVDTPGGKELRTDYIGNLTLPGTRRGAHHHHHAHPTHARAAAAGPPACG
jgi:hypothetical protein